MRHALPHDSALRENGNDPPSWTLFDRGRVADAGNRSVCGTSLSMRLADSQVAIYIALAIAVPRGEFMQVERGLDH